MRSVGLFYIHKRFDMQNDEENILIDWLLLIEQLMNGEITQAYYDSKVYGDCDE